MQHKRTWGSILTSVPVVLSFTAIALALTWGLVGAGQNVQNVQTPGTPQVTIPYPTWGDGTTQPDHMVPGKPWDSAYQPDKWPSQRQRAYVKQLENYHPDLYAAWGTRLNQALTNKKLDRRSEMLIAAAIASLVHWARPVVEYYVDSAYEAGSNTTEIMSAIESVVDVSGHSENDGFMAVWYVVNTREQAGKPTPLKGAPLTAQDLIPPSDWTPARFKYQSPNPRPDGLARRTFDPVLEETEELQREERRKLQPGFSGGLTPGVSGRMSELLFIAGDMAVVRWPDPLLDQHQHEALNRGSNLQEIIEVMMVAAELVQGAGDSNIAGLQRPTGLAIMAHGLQALSRVVAERSKAEFKTPDEYGEGFTTQQPAPQQGSVQRPASIEPRGTPQGTIPYPTWGDGSQPDHMVPGHPWATAYQPDKWPSQRQRAYVEQLENYHPQLYALWGKRLNQALTNRKLDKRYEMLVAVATASLAHWARPVIEYYVDLAFDAGSNTSEIMEAMKAGSEVNGHSLYDGLGALWYVVQAREKAGKPTPLEGAPLADKDLIPSSEWTPVRFKYQLPNPRPHGLARWKFDPAGEEIGRRQAAERRKLQLPQHLPARMEELLWMASDTAVVRWPDPLLDHHHHLALNRGSNLQEIVEVMMVAAEVVQGAEDSNIAGRRVPAAVAIMAHGLEALSRVVAERDKAGYKTPAEYGEGFTKKMY